MAAPRTRVPGLITAALLLALICAPGAHASRAQPTLFDASQELTGDLATDCTPGGAVTLCDQTLEQVRALGADSVRVLVYWRDVVAAPNATTRPCGSPGSLNGPDNPASSCYLAGWGRYDSIVRAIAGRGMGVALVPTGKFPHGRVPRWASNDSRDTDADPAEFREFLEALGRRYSGSFDPPGIEGVLPAVQYVGVWNEVNNEFQFGPQRKNGRFYAPGLYRRLFRAATAGLDEAGFDGQVWIGETAPRGTSRAQSPLAFMRSVLCLKRVRVRGRVRLRARCGRLDADAWAHHPHTGAFTPFERPFGSSAGDVTTGNLGAMTRLLRGAKRAGALPTARLAITEYGVQSDPPDEFLGVSFAAQAEYIGIAEYLAYRKRTVSLWSQYLMRDDAALGGFQSGLRFHGGGAKPALDAFRTPLVARRKRGRRAGRRVILWGEVRPVGDATVRIEKRDPSDGAFVPLTGTFSTDANGYFQLRSRFRPGRVYRIRWDDGADGLSACPGASPCLGPAIRVYRF